MQVAREILRKCSALSVGENENEDLDHIRSVDIANKEPEQEVENSSAQNCKERIRKQLGLTKSIKKQKDIITNCMQDVAHGMIKTSSPLNL